MTPITQAPPKEPQQHQQHRKENGGLAMLDQLLNATLIGLVVGVIAGFAAVLLGADYPVIIAAIGVGAGVTAGLIGRKETRGQHGA